MSHRKYIISQYNNCDRDTPGMVPSGTSKKNKRPAQGREDEEHHSAKRRNIFQTPDYIQGLTSSHQWSTDAQNNHEHAPAPPIPPHLPNRVPVSLRINVPERLNVPHVMQESTASPYGYYSSLSGSEYEGYPPTRTPVSLSGWHFISPTYPPSIDPPPNPPEVTRNVLYASSSYDVQWHRETRQRSLAEYDDHSPRRDPIPPGRCATSPRSLLFPRLDTVQDSTYSSEEEEDHDDFELVTARSMSPEPFSPQDAQFIPECIVSSSLASGASRHGKLRALVISLEYRGDGQRWQNGSSMSIQGPYRDGSDIYDLLRDQGYHADNITFMMDSPSTSPELQPTRANIKYQLERLVAGAAPGDRFFLYYAGHGAQVKDINGDEADGLDEAIIPSDWATTYNYSDEGLIIDDYLKEVCVDPLPKGAHLTAVFDCCHAGTIMDLTYEHSSKSNSPGFKFNRLTGLSSRRLSSRFQSVDGRVLCISACEDNQQAYGRQRGLLTEAFARCIRRFAKPYYLLGVRLQLNPTLKQLYEYLLQYGRPDPERYGRKYIQDPVLATTFRLSIAEYHRPLLV